ncbi:MULTISPECIES: LysR family transcriptional regulator [Vibrio]|uniref:LysR family transcriptional regulator n=1 Tax=Vibrio TaxID=662 RepID=UPI002074C955|nr:MULTISPECIES: LysR family transcriptional regulator [Vibrio]USD34442.1 LysR family transcriptional regulator [Vibrio sp. SCSIO 43186]USD47514.1 LysR family transcriptional regulator [Vibrio sp. SCSIO 43145]USD71567.1 LysR family transcriptional regulator [Vibrio sp. SCSIO 43139]USD98473.1 LysR family transcriptional regulator [Vibrio coralliilyticus]
MKSLPTQLPIFIQVAKSGSFAAAARELGISAPAVSKAITKLEQEWQVKLFFRSSHSLSLTQTGQQLAESLTPSMESIQTTIEQLAEHSSAAAGTIKINLPSSSIGQEHILPLVIEFMAKYPQINCDLHFDDRNVDLVEHGFDLGIGVAINQDSRLIARPLLTQDIGIYAAPSYLAQYGEPKALEDLANHHCIPVRSLTSGRFHYWRINDAEHAKLYEPNGRLVVNNFAAAKQATLAGAGISMLGSWLFRDELVSGEVKPIMKQYWGAPTTIWVYYSSREYLPTRVRLLIDYLVENIYRMA